MHGKCVLIDVIWPPMPRVPSCEGMK